MTDEPWPRPRRVEDKWVKHRSGRPYWLVYPHRDRGWEIDRAIELRDRDGWDSCPPIPQLRAIADERKRVANEKKRVAELVANEQEWERTTGMKLYTPHTELDRLESVPERYVPMASRWWVKLLVFLCLAGYR